MKKLLSLMTISLIISCGSKEAKISGKIKNMEGSSMLYLLTMNKEDRALKPIDSLQISEENSTFSFNVNMNESGFVVLEIKGENTPPMGKEFFISNNDDFKVTLDYAQRLEILESSGSDLFNQFRSSTSKVQELKTELATDSQELERIMLDKSSDDKQKIEDLQKKVEQNKELLKKYPYEFSKQNKDSDLTPWLYLFCTGLLPEFVDENNLREITDGLSEKTKKSTWGSILMNYINTMKGSELGDAEFDEIEENKKISLKSLRGKKVYLRFWIKGYEENLFPFLEKINGEYKDKIEIVSVYLGNEQDKEIWKETLQGNKTSWMNLFSNFDIAEKYMLSSPFSSFLLDEKGVIIAKDLNDLELEEKLKEILI